MVDRGGCDSRGRKASLKKSSKNEYCTRGGLGQPYAQIQKSGVHRILTFDKQ
jgi:hypothetical protein